MDALIEGFTRRGQADFYRSIAQERFAAAAVNFCTGSQAVADFFGTFWSVGEPFQQGAQVKTGAGGDDRKFFSEAQIVQDAEGAAAIFPGGENFFGIEQVDQMVGDALLLGWQNFSGADIEVTVDL